VINPLRDDRRAALILALLRATLLVVILVSEQLVDANQLATSAFFVVLGVAAVYAMTGIATALRPLATAARGTPLRLLAVLDLVLLTGLAYTSGGAYSDARKAFFVIPMAAAFSERPRFTANWSMLAVVAFTLQATVAGGHPHGVINTWPRLTLNQDLYLAWTGAAATLLAFALRRRSAQVHELAALRQRLVTQAMDSVERERTRLANALHDSPVQNLIAARHDLRRAERTGERQSFQRLHEALDETITELRREIFDLHPHVLDHAGLRAALEQVARRQPGDTKIQITVGIEPGIETPHQEMLFALGRELLGNASKHARAKNIQLNVRRGTGSVTLEVADDGCGIAEGRIRNALLEGHIGLAAVKERVAALNGSLRIATAPGEGTAVRIILPDAVDAQSAPNERPPADVSDRVTGVDALRVSTA
jgi:two-component system, NarL family, sensor kinase